MDLPVRCQPRRCRDGPWPVPRHAPGRLVTVTALRSRSSACPLCAKSGPHSAFARLTTGGHFRLDSFVLKTILSLRVTCSRQCQLALHATDEPGKRGERSLVLEAGNP